MRTVSSLTTAFLCCLVSLPFMNLQAAKYAGEPFHLGVGARALGMGGAFAAVADDVTSGFWNPAGLASLPNRQIILMHSETFGSLLNHDYVAFSSPIGSESPSTAAAASLTRLGGGGIKLTRWDHNLNSPVVEKEVGHDDYQLILSYAVRWSDRLRLGSSAKIIYKRVGDNSAFGIGSDLGAQYDAHDNIRLALMLRDATTTLLSWDTGTKESIFPTMIPGIAYSRDFGQFDATVSADAELKFEHYEQAAQYWVGSISADTRFGFEIAFQKSAYGRAGSDMGRLCLGAGIALSSILLDIAYMRQTDIDDSFRISLLYNIE